jgi:hypothetical protein
LTSPFSLINKWHSFNDIKKREFSLVIKIFREFNWQLLSKISRYSWNLKETRILVEISHSDISLCMLPPSRWISLFLCSRRIQDILKISQRATGMEYVCMFRYLRDVSLNPSIWKSIQANKNAEKSCIIVLDPSCI